MNHGRKRSADVTVISGSCSKDRIIKHALLPRLSLDNNYTGGNGCGTRTENYRPCKESRITCYIDRARQTFIFTLEYILYIYIHMYIYVTYLHIDRKIDRCFLRLDTFHCFGRTRKYDGKSLVCIEALNDLGSSIGKIIKLRESGKIDERARFR